MCQCKDWELNKWNRLYVTSSKHNWIEHSGGHIANKKASMQKHVPILLDGNKFKMVWKILNSWSPKN